MRITALFIFWFSSFSLLPGQSTFYKNYLKEDLDREVFNIVQTSDGGFALLGIVDTENASTEVGVTKLDCTGAVEWAKKYGISGTIGNVFGGIIEADNGDIVFAYSVGTFQNYDILLSRVNAGTGDIVWSKRLGGSRDDQARDLIQTIDGNFVVIGGTSSYGTGSSGQVAFTDVYLLKVDGDGNLIWTQTFGEGGQIDAGYAIREDNNGNLLATGRYLVGGTFYAFLLKTDPDGVPIFFKGFGQPNHRTYGYDVEISPDGDYVLVGSTTIDKVDFTSYPDPFLIKTNNQGDTLFTKIYYPWVGSDRSESASSIVIQEDGGYGIGVPTLSFTTHTVGFVPNKNAIFSTDSEGSLQQAYIYTQGSSHYTQLRKATDSGFLLSNFSNFFSPTFEFLPLIIKADEDYLCGCNEIDVTGEVSTVTHPWDVQDITNYSTDDGSFNNNISGGADFDYSMIDIQCENFPEVESAFDFSGFCLDEPVIFTDSSTNNVTSWTWDFGDGNGSADQNPSHLYENSGEYTTSLIVTDGCFSDTSNALVEIFDLEILEADTTICEGETVFLGGAPQSESGVYIDTLPPVDSLSCERILETTLIVEMCNCDELEFGNIFTPNGDGENDQFVAVSNCEIDQIRNFNLKIFNRWGKLVFESNDYQTGWDGMLDGEAAASDVYLFTASYELLINDNYESKSSNGDLTLMR